MYKIRVNVNQNEKIPFLNENVNGVFYFYNLHIIIIKW